MQRVDVSICIATWRRPQGLARLLESLLRQKLPPGLELEVLVVDNDAQQSAAPVLERFRSRLPLRCFVEPQRNIACARNCALEHARGAWIAFVDDDEELCEGWLSAYWTRIQQGDADGWFGPVRPHFEAGGRALAACLYRGPRARTAPLLGVAELSTSNACVRRSLIETRRFDPSFGRSGGEDSEFFGRCLRAGARLRWCAEAIVTEYVPAERQRLRWLAQRAFRGGTVATRLERRWRPGIALDLARAARALAGLALFSCAAPILLCAGAVPAVAAWLRVCTQAGHLFSLCGGSYEEYRG